MAIHRFVPSHYHATLGSHAAVLEVESGDTIVTQCIDSAGLDRHDQKVGPTPNPMTGPFAVRGAQPGDTLVVEFHRLTPTRRRGWSGVLVAPHVVDGGDVPRLAQLGSFRERWDWDVDAKSQTVTLNHPDSPLHGLRLPSQIMVGCFGVAPAHGQAISTMTSGQHGGNMDYRWLGEATRVYFPVAVEGGLFFLGDGHALQGDGEVSAAGIEIAMEAEFTLSLIKGRAPVWPRGENAEYIFTIGNARPLDQCVQHATSEMIRWLEQDYGLDAKHASLLLGQCARYDLGNIYDPAYTMVCKLPKAVLGLLPGQSQ